jgi:hypothetical protein
MAMGLSIGIGIPSGILNSNAAPVLDSRIIAENGDFIVSEIGEFLIIEEPEPVAQILSEIGDILISESGLFLISE